MTEERFFLVRLEPGLPTFRRNGLAAAIKQHPGIELVCDLSAISRVTLDTMLLQPAAVQAKRRRRKSGRVTAA